MQRYFADIENNIVHLKEDDVHHIVHVLRMKVGDLIQVVDLSKLYICEITSLNPFEVKINETQYEDVELGKSITLFFALAKGDKIDLVIQKATELGALHIVLFKSRRCVVNFDQKDISKKFNRYQKIAKEASQQCHRLYIPIVHGVYDLKKINKYNLSDVNYLAYEKEAGNTTNSLIIPSEAKSISIMIGPEGGFDEDEVEYLKSLGFKTVSLGKRILRCETAAIYALSVIGYKLES